MKKEMDDYVARLNSKSLEEKSLAKKAFEAGWKAANGKVDQPTTGPNLLEAEKGPAVKMQPRTAFVAPGNNDANKK